MLNLFTEDKKINALLCAFFMSYTALLAIITLDTLWSTASNGEFWRVWLLQITPLIMLLPGIFAQRYRSYSWVCFLMLAYFASYVVQTYSPTSLVIDWLGLSMTVIIFIIAMYASRLLQRYFIAR